MGLDPSDTPKLSIYIYLPAYAHFILTASLILHYLATTWDDKIKNSNSGNHVGFIASSTAVLHIYIYIYIYIYMYIF